MIRCIRVLSLEDWSYLALLDHLLRHTFVPRIRYLGFTIRGKKGLLTTTGDLSACKSKQTLIQLLTVNRPPQVPKRTPLTHTYTRATKTTQTTNTPMPYARKGRPPKCQLLEFGGPCQAPKASLQFGRPKDFLYTWSFLLKNTCITMLPNLPCHQNY
jgi:hypothetical protein